MATWSSQVGPVFAGAVAVACNGAVGALACFLAPHRQEQARAGCQLREGHDTVGAWSDEKQRGCARKAQGQIVHPDEGCPKPPVYSKQAHWCPRQPRVAAVTAVHRP